MLKGILKRYLGIEGLDDPTNTVVLRFALFFAAAAVGLRLFFWWYTGRVWEDALVAAVCSENCARGLGLSAAHLPGQPPVQSFTNPLIVLIPLIGDLLRNGSGLALMKMVSALAGGISVLYAMAIVIHPRIKLPAPLGVLLLGYVACEHHQILWGMTGIETQLSILALLMSFYYTIAFTPLTLGLSLALCMWARPDYAFWTLIVGAYILLAPRPGTARLRPFVHTVGIALALYLPWIVFATIYYGSPIPNTILAKGIGYSLWSAAPDLTWSSAAHTVWSRITGTYEYHTLFQPLGPSFAGNGSHYQPLVNDYGLISDAVTLFAAVGALASLWKRQGALLLAAAFVVIYAIYYVFLVAVVFSWYVTPFVLLVLLLSARGLQALAAPIGNTKGRTGVLTAVTLLYLAMMMFFLPKTFSAERKVQQYVEDPIRKAIGVYLSEIMGPNDTAGCEPLGYIGYYAQRTVYDWPGLGSREVVAYSKAHPEGRRLSDMLEALRPNFIVLRYEEYAKYFSKQWIDTDYRIVASFEISLPQTRDIPGIIDNADTGFFVLVERGRAVREIGINPAHSRAQWSVGLRLAQQNRLPEAEAWYRRALVTDPSYTEAHNNLGTLLARTGRAAEAESEFRTALRLGPPSAKACYNLANILATSGRIAEAIPYFLESVSLDPTNAEAWFNLGVAQAQQSKWQEAFDCFDKALEVNPSLAPARQYRDQIRTKLNTPR